MDHAFYGNILGNMSQHALLVDTFNNEGLFAEWHDYAVRNCIQISIFTPNLSFDINMWRGNICGVEQTNMLLALRPFFSSNVNNRCICAHNWQGILVLQPESDSQIWSKAGFRGCICFHFLYNFAWTSNLMNFYLTCKPDHVTTKSQETL